MLVEILPKYSVASVMGFLKGKSSIMIYIKRVASDECKSQSQRLLAEKEKPPAKLVEIYYKNKKISSLLIIKDLILYHCLDGAETQI